MIVKILLALSIIAIVILMHEIDRLNKKIFEINLKQINKDFEKRKRKN